MNPAVGVCGGSNHDVSILLRLPVVPPSEKPCTAEEMDFHVNNAIADMSRGINDANLFVHAHVIKQHPHLINLYISFGEGLQQLQDEFDAALKKGEPEESPEYRSKHIFFRLMCRSNSVMHKGMPEMCAFLLGHTELRCSHAFRPLFAGGFLRYATIIWKMYIGTPQTVADGESFGLCTNTAPKSCATDADDDGENSGDDEKNPPQPFETHVWITCFVQRSLKASHCISSGLEPWY